MKDQGFPCLKFDPQKSAQDWGEQQGESFRSAIRELFEIRIDLLRSKNPLMSGRLLDQYCQDKWNYTRKHLVKQAEELEGIRRGAGLNVSEVVVLNAYTDVRDIVGQGDDQGCTTYFKTNADLSAWAGQSWDMHSSAKNFLCVFEIPRVQNSPKMYVLSLLGTLGLMGFTEFGEVVGVNNLNSAVTQGTAIWPAMVRALLEASGMSSKRKLLNQVALTSARCFMLGDKNEGSEIWEVFPELKVCQSSLKMGDDRAHFHTNHCLDPRTQKLENVLSQASTSHDRYRLMEKKATSPKTLNEFKSVLQDHESYPKSICSHFQSGAADPSHTCGGAVGDLVKGEVVMWRGCHVYEKESYKEYLFRF